jgi:hypothetical protein
VLSRNFDKFLVLRDEYVFWTHVSELMIIIMKKSGSFCEYAQHDPNLVFSVGFIIEASKFNVAN